MNYYIVLSRNTPELPNIKFDTIEGFMNYDARECLHEAEYLEGLNGLEVFKMKTIRDGIEYREFFVEKQEVSVTKDKYDRCTQGKILSFKSYNGVLPTEDVKDLIQAAKRNTNYGVGYINSLKSNPNYNLMAMAFENGLQVIGIEPAPSAEVITKICNAFNVGSKPPIIETNDLIKNQWVSKFHS